MDFGEGKNWLMSRIKVRSISITIWILLVIHAVAQVKVQVQVGADLLLTKHFSLIEGKRIGLVTNHSAVLANGELLADALFKLTDTKLVALFGPEHGIRGTEPAGNPVEDKKDAKTGLPMFSLFGSTSKPTKEMLHGIDVLIYDIQDVGARFYTFESTLSLAMEAAAELNIPFIVLDRPNPIRGVSVEGYTRLDSLRSFVGLNPTPITHAMTIGELATMINEEGWLKNHLKANLSIVRMEGWRRDMWYDETGLPWIKPSPNMTSLTTAIVYPGTCLIEGTNLSEGRGTDHPFEYIGAPFVDGRKWAELLNSQNIAGAAFEAVKFKPRTIVGTVDNPKYSGVECGGIFVRVTGRNDFNPVSAAVQILASAKILFGKDFRWNERWIDRLAGSAKLRLDIDAGKSVDKVVDGWNTEVAAFKLIREKYLLY